MRRCMFLGVLLAGLLMASVAHADTAMNELETAAGEQASPENATQAKTAQKHLMPYVKEAIKAGDTAGLEGLAETNATVAGAVLRVGGKAVVLTPKKSSHIKKEALSTGETVEEEHELPEEEPVSEQEPESSPEYAGYCYGGEHSQTNYNTAIGTIAWVYTSMPVWCGVPNGYISYNAAPGFAQWSWGPYCLESQNHLWNWDAYPKWQHGGNWAEVGVSYVWGCAGIRGVHATLRIAANGYWDTYDDFGF